MSTNVEKRLTPAEKMKKLRGSKTKAEVALAIGVSESSYVKYERGERVPRDVVKRRIADYYGRSVDFIFFD